MTENLTTTHKQNTLWTKDFTIITIGSVVSMFGNSMVGFAMGLMVLDYTNSSLLYAIYIMLFTLPQLIMPIISGAILDRFSRKKMIYTLDFISSGIYLVMAITLVLGIFDFTLFAIVTFILGSIQSSYEVAYDSFYPLLITDGNYQKAYSISGMLNTLAMCMVPVATFVYNLIGIGPIMIVSAVSFFIAACLETRIMQREDYIEKRALESSESNQIKRMINDVKEGLAYLQQERGLLAICLYFCFSSIATGVANVLALPYYKGTFSNGEYLYIIIVGMSVVGRAIGGGIHYKIRIPAEYKYGIAMVIYIMISILEGAYMFMPVAIAMTMCFLTGIGGITTYTIRISSTQNYVPDEKKGRFNGAFMLLITLGTLIGELFGGAASTFFDSRFVVLVFNMLPLIAAIILIGGNKKEVSRIYNTDN